jgi:hypothetical protein
MSSSDLASAIDLPIPASENYILKLQMMNYLSKRAPLESEDELSMSFIIHKIRILSIEPIAEATLEEQIKRVCIKPLTKAEKHIERDVPKKSAHIPGYRLLTQSVAPSCSSFLRDAYKLGDMAKLSRNKM